MAVYFVFRSHYDEPSGKLLRRFDEPTVLDWFRARWDAGGGEEGAHSAVYDLLGWYVDPFIDLFGAAARRRLPPPANDQELEAYLDEFVECESTTLCRPHLLTIRHLDECNLESCVYLFDDAFLAEHRDRAAFLLHDDWRLPGGHSEDGEYLPGEDVDDSMTPAARGDGATYFVILFYDYENEGNLTELWGPARIPGVRAPDLAAYLALPPEPIEDPFLLLLRSRLFDAPFTDDPLEEEFRRVLLGEGDARPPGEAVAALRAYSDWLQERQDRPAGLLFLEQALRALCRLPVAHLPWCEFGPIGAVRRRLDDALASGEIRSHFDNRLDDPNADEYPTPDLCRVHVEEHLAQLCLNTEHWRSFHRADLYHQWFFFDDRWAAAHPVLAEALLRYARFWDVLSPDGPHD